MDRDDHVKLLGEGAGRSQQLELCTAQLLARALQVPESTARLLATKMGQAAILQVLEELARRRQGGSLDPDNLASWVKVAQEANQARNRIIHWPWVTDVESGTTAVLANGSMKTVPRDAADLQSDIDALAAAVVAAQDL